MTANSAPQPRHQMQMLRLLLLWAFSSPARGLEAQCPCSGQVVQVVLVPACGCASQQCPAGTCNGTLVPKLQMPAKCKDGHTNCTQDDCCDRTCTPDVCSKGLVPKPTLPDRCSADGSPCTAAVCCDPAPTPPPPSMSCPLNCYGPAAEPLALKGAVGTGDNLAVMNLSLDACKAACSETKECEGVVWGRNMCFGKKRIYSSKCQPGGDFVTEIIGVPMGVCALLGDPHIVTFDNPSGSFLDQFGVGEFWLVKAAALKITGRFGYSQRFPDDSSTVGIAVSVGGHTLALTYTGPKLGPEGFKMFWDGNRILSTFPGYYQSSDSRLDASCDYMDPSTQHPKARHTIGGTSELMPSCLFKFRNNLTVYVLLGDEVINAVIEAPKQEGGQDGYCGNFNCDATDDTLQALQARGMAGTVDPSESLFKDVPPMRPAQLLKGTREGTGTSACKPEVRAKAEEKCKGIPEVGLREACVYDACAAGSTQTLAMDVAVGQAEEHAAINAGQIAGKFIRGFLNFEVPDLPWQFFAGSGAAVLTAFVGCMYLGRSTRRGPNRDVKYCDGSRHSGGNMDSVLLASEAPHSDGEVEEMEHLLA